MLKEIPEVSVHYEILEKKENPNETVIRKTGMVADFTMGEIAVDMELLQRKRLELEGQLKVEAARLVNIDNTNPEIGAMSEEMRQVIYIYAKSFAFVKVAKDKMAEIDEQIKEYRQEAIKIALETGLSLEGPVKTDETNG